MKILTIILMAMVPIMACGESAQLDINAHVVETDSITIANSKGMVEVYMDNRTKADIKVDGNQITIVYKQKKLELSVDTLTTID